LRSFPRDVLQGRKMRNSHRAHGLEELADVLPQIRGGGRIGEQIAQILRRS
jgi:hypothetical protein